MSEESIPADRQRGGACARASIAVMLTVLLTGAAVADEPAGGNPHLTEAMAHIDRGDLSSARSALDRAMAHPKNCNEDLVEIYATLAVLHLYAGEENLAYEAYARLLNIDPRYELPAHTAEPLRELFERVGKAYEDGHLRAVRVAHDPPGRLPTSVPTVISATISNLPDDFEAHLHFRAQGQGPFESRNLALRPGHRWAAAIPVESLEREDGEIVMEYYVEVTNEAGHRVQGAGSAREPYLLRVVPGLLPAEEPPPPRGPAWYQQPWVWGAVGGVAAGTVAAVYLSTRQESTGTLPVRVRLRE